MSKYPVFSPRARGAFLSCILAAALFPAGNVSRAADLGDLSAEELRERAGRLADDLEKTREALAKKEAEKSGPAMTETESPGAGGAEKSGAEEDVPEADPLNARDVTENQRLEVAEGAAAEGESPDKIRPGHSIPALRGLEIGGAIRVNYTLGDFREGSTSASRGRRGSVALDTALLKFDYERGDWFAKGRYRFYPGFDRNNDDSIHFPHTAWVGHNFENTDQLRVGLHRTPFGPGPFGVSQSWLFDQHYYVGLSDNMNLGARYTIDRIENWIFDLSYAAAAAPNGGGNRFGRRSARYSYAVVDEAGDGYEESHQVNVRGIYSTQFGGVSADLGTSLQFEILDSNGPQDDGEMFAGSAHALFKWKNWTLAPQLTYYHYNVESNFDQGGSLRSDDVVQMGAFDFPTLVAAEAWVPAVSLSYYHETDGIPWLDYVTPYFEYSSILKEEEDFNDSDLVVLGMALARGGWFINADLGYSNGNDFIGNDSGFGDTSNQIDAGRARDGFFSSNRFGENPEDAWEMRFNLNLGYYF